MKILIEENENYILLVTRIECTDVEIHNKEIVGTSDFPDAITLLKKHREFMNSTGNQLIMDFAANVKTQINNGLKSKNNLHIALDLTDTYGLKISFEAIKKQVKSNKGK